MKIRVLDRKENRTNRINDMMGLIYTKKDGTIYYADVEGRGYFVEDAKETDRYILMRSTGVCDKNGAEIFEGDIIQHKDGLLAEVKFGEYEQNGEIYSTVGFWLDAHVQDEEGLPPLIVPLVAWEECEIVGDIYENGGGET